MRTTPTPSRVFAAGLSGTMSQRRAAGIAAIRLFYAVPTCSLESVEPEQKVESAYKIETNMIFHAFPRFLNVLDSERNFVFSVEKILSI
jgi:hypothetical protein